MGMCRWGWGDREKSHKSKPLKRNDDSILIPSNCLVYSEPDNGGVIEVIDSDGHFVYGGSVIHV